MAGQRASILRAAAAWRLAVALCVWLSPLSAFAVDAQAVYNIDLPAEDLASALNALSEQTGAPVVFAYDLVKDRKTHPVVGRLRVLEALDALLEGTGLTGGVSDKGVLTVSESRRGAPPPTQTSTMQRGNEEQMSKSRGARPKGLAALLASVGAALSASAHGASDETASSDDMVNVVITAQKREERLQDVPVPVTVLKGDTLAQNNQVQLRDYAASVPGFSVTPNVIGAQTLSIRGITVGGFSNPTVGVMIDDTPYGETVGGAANDVPDLDPGDLARIEVLRGPQGTLYGANSMGGLVKYVTKDPSTEAFSGRIEAGYSGVQNGAEPGFSVRASANIPLGDTFAMRVSGYARQDPGYVDNPLLGLKGVNKAEADGARWSALWRPIENLSIKLSAVYEYYRSHGSADFVTGLGDLHNNYIPGIGGDDRKIQAYSATLKYKIGRFELTSVTGYNVNRDTNSSDDSLGFGKLVKAAFGVTGAPFYDIENITKVTQELRLSTLIGENFEWLLGGFYTHENSPGAGLFTAVDPTTGNLIGDYYYYTLPQKYEEYSGFTNLTYHFTDRFDVQIGGRETHIALSTPPAIAEGPYIGPTPTVTPPTNLRANAFTYLFTPEFKLTPELMLYARIASGYRPGRTNSAASVKGGAPSGSDPDKTQNYEVGFKGDLFDHVLSVDASLYYIDWKNIQIQLRTPTNFPYNTNGSAAKSEGAELSVDVRPLPGLTLGAWIAYDDAVLTRALPPTTGYGRPGDRLPFSSRYSGNLSAEEDFRLWGDATGFLAQQASYVGDRISVFQATAARQYLPAYATVNLRAGVRQDSWTFSLYANNVTDRRGLLNGGPGYFLPNSFSYTTPRTVGASVSKQF